MFSFEVAARSGRARAGILRTPHGALATPAFMPVGTAGAVKAMTHRDLEAAGAQILLANTYHLMLRPGEDLVRSLGGLHGFTPWKKPFLTDSGGYQVMSLRALREIDDAGVAFASHLDGTRHFLSPERSMDVQMKLGADIVMALDECPPHPAEASEVESAVERTARWAERSRRAHTRGEQWLFGIVQGGVDEALRRRSASQIVGLDFPGYAIGGLSVGESKPAMRRVLEVVDTLLPEDRPRYLMGVGTPEDIFDAVSRGVDMFDCVLPTRNARNGQLFTAKGRLAIRNARFRDDPRPPDEACACLTCRTTSRAYLRHLHLAGEITAAVLMTLHNVSFYLDTLRAIGQSIRLGHFKEFRERSLETLCAGAAEGSA